MKSYKNKNESEFGMSAKKQQAQLHQKYQKKKQSIGNEKCFRHSRASRQVDAGNSQNIQIIISEQMPSTIPSKPKKKKIIITQKRIIAMAENKFVNKSTCMQNEKYFCFHFHSVEL